MTATVTNDQCHDAETTATPVAASVQEGDDHDKVGEIKASFDCVYRAEAEDCAGKLLVGSNGIGFSAPMTHFVLSWNSISKVEWDDDTLCVQTATADSRFNAFDEKEGVLERIQEERLENDKTEQNYLAACAVAAMANFRSDSVYRLAVADESKEEEEEETAAAATDLEEDDSQSPVQQAWTRLRNSADPSYKEEGIAPHKLPCTLDTFYQEFFADGARHSIARYQETDIGDSELETSDWKVDEDDDAKWTRTISYRHPVTAPMAPPSALATKSQVLRRFGAVGLVLETRTVVLDVPLTDCFVVDDIIWVEASSEEEVTLEARFEIRFVKGTMFRRIIETTTRGEFKSWFTGLAKMMTLAVEDVDDDAKEQATPVAPVTAPTSQPTLPSAAVGLPRPWLFLFGTGVVVLLVLQILTLWQMKTLHGRIQLLETLLAQQNEALLEASGDESGNDEL